MSTPHDDLDFEIRDATIEDAATIAEFNSRLSDETEGKRLDPKLIGPGVVAMLSDASKGRYWVAEKDGEVIGQIMVTLEWSDWRNGMIWWIQSVYIRDDYRRAGVFTALYRHVESLAKETPDVTGIRLYVEKSNERAQAAYVKLGMIDTDYRMMQTIWRRTFPGDA
ncbi:MAG: GNAT family N-acetyltransferase [Woeseiaceae bacterium]|nr:GNAT family N-acetyltransferase [Woeseiaceae bacterium]